MEVTKVQREVLKLLCAGNTDIQSAKILHKTPKTVKDTVDRLKNQLNAVNRPHLVVQAILTGVISVESLGVINESYSSKN